MRLAKAAKAFPHAKIYNLSTAYNDPVICSDEHSGAVHQRALLAMLLFR